MGNLITQEERIKSVAIRKIGEYTLHFLLTKDTVRVSNAAGIATKKDIFEIEDLESLPDYPSFVLTRFTNELFIPKNL